MTQQAKRRKAPAADGRTQRAERSRAAIEDAVYALVKEGALEPTAREIADRAGVGLRSVFRHFQDMESLYATLDARLIEDVLPILEEQPPKGGMKKRADAFVRRRQRLFERIAPFKRSSNLIRQRSPYVSRQQLRLTSALRLDLVRWLPEFDGAAREILEAADLCTSIEAWDRLRSEQRLGPVRARNAVAATLDALLTRATRSHRGR